MGFTIGGNFDPISMGVSAVNGIVGAISAKKQQKRQYEYNTKLQEQQAALNMDAWREQYDRQYNDQMSYLQDMRSYNSPTAQMDRLAQAGINPNFIASGSINNTATGSPDVNANGAGVGNPGVGLTQYNPDVAGKYAQLRVAEAEAARDRADARLKNTQSGALEIKTPAELKKVMAETAAILEQKDLSSEQIKKVKADTGAVAQYVSESAARAQSTLMNAYTSRLAQQTRQQVANQQHWYNQHSLGIQSQNANANMVQAVAAKQNADTNYKSFKERVRQEDERISIETGKLEREYEKMSREQFAAAVERNTTHYKIGSLGFDHTNPERLARDLAYISAGNSYLQKWSNEISQMTDPPREQYILYQRSINAFNMLVDKIRNAYRSSTGDDLNSMFLSE